jgi:hypothetical protein
VAILATTALLAGCGDSATPPKRADRARAPAPRPAPRSTRSSEADVIRRWSDTLRAGDVSGATRLFGLPAIVENGEPPRLLTTRAQVRAFNASLPCGARLLRTRRRGRYTVATFRLTERPGGGCGTGVGDTAETAFKVRRGRIVEWLRVPVGPRAPRPPSLPPDTSTS